MIQVSGLNIYPVKGLAGIPLQQAQLTAKGLAYDRHWMVIMPNGRMVTQRQKSKMATLQTQLTASGLIISAPECEPIEVPLERQGLESVPVTLWRDQFTALDEGEEVSRWLTEVLESNYALRLVRMDDSVVRPQSKPELLGNDTSTKFADSAPLLVVNENSLADLNRQLESLGLQPVPIERFRGNIIVKGMPEYQEYCLGALAEASGRYRIGLRFPSERCVVVNTDQKTGVVDKETQQPLNTLKEMSTAPGLDGAYFGQNSLVQEGLNEFIRIGDSLELEVP